MTLSVKGAGIGGLIVVVRILADGRPFLSGLAAGAGSIGPFASNVPSLRTISFISTAHAPEFGV